MRRLLSLDWDAIAGVVAAVVAIVMHFLHLIDEGVLLMITVVLLALSFCAACGGSVSASAWRAAGANRNGFTDIRHALKPPDAILIGPRQLACSQRFAGQAQGDMVWFHVCLLMFKPQLLRPAVENPIDPFNSCWTGVRSLCGSRRSCRNCGRAGDMKKFAGPAGPGSRKMFPSSCKRPKPCELLGGASCPQHRTGYPQMITVVAFISLRRWGPGTGAASGCRGNNGV